MLYKIYISRKLLCNKSIKHLFTSSDYLVVHSFIPYDWLFDINSLLYCYSMQHYFMFKSFFLRPINLFLTRSLNNYFQVSTLKQQIKTYLDRHKPSLLQFNNILDSLNDHKPFTLNGSKMRFLQSGNILSSYLNDDTKVHTLISHCSESSYESFVIFSYLFFLMYLNVQLTDPSTSNCPRGQCG